MFLCQINYAQVVPENVQKLQKYYPQIIEFKENKLFFKDGSSLIYLTQKQEKNKLFHLKSF